MKHRQIIVLIAGLFIAALLVPLAGAQEEINIEGLLVEVWPEYDRPEVLVIFRAQLDPAVSLPATLTFPLPGYIDGLNAIAFEEDGVLRSVRPESIEQTVEGNSLLLTFETPSPTIQLEYYDPNILTRDGQNRSLGYRFLAPYDVARTTFELQAPAQAENFTMLPDPSRTTTDVNGLSYSLLDVAGISAGDIITLQATYQRPTNALSTELIGTISEHAEEIPSEHAAELLPADSQPPPAQSAPPAPQSPAESGSGSSLALAYILIGVGAGLLLGAAGHWYWYDYRPARTGQSPAVQAGSGALAYCYQCGTALRPDSKFCHNCGANRRKEVAG